MSDSALSLLTTRRFAPLFITQFLGAMNDNVFKNALIILTLFRLATGESAQILVTVAAGVFVLPFFLFSATAGQIADKYEKSGLIRRIKFLEIVIMALGTAGLYLGDTYLLLGVLFLTGAQSTFFGPLKYGILPDHLRENELIGGNALIEAGTFIATLMRTIVGGLFVLGDHGLTIIASIVLGLSVLGWITSHTIPKAPATAVGIQINPNFIAETWRIIVHARAKRNLFLSILGISWFWLVGTTFLTQFPNLTKSVLGGNEEVVTLLLTSFAIGIGSILCTVLLRGEVSRRYVPLAAIAMTAFITDLYFAVADRTAGDSLIGAAAFAVRPENWRVLFDLMAIAIASGLYSVPLYATLQNESAPEHRARNAAANNAVNSLFMVVGALWAAAMLAAKISVPIVLLSIAVGNALVAIYICKLLPHHLIKTVLAIALRLAFRVRVEGLDNYRRAGDRAVIIANHGSILDGILLAVFLPGRSIVAIDTQFGRTWWMRPFLSIARAVAIDPSNPFATRLLIKAVREGNPLVIFPEGRDAIFGAPMKPHEGPAMIADKADAALIPIRIAGAGSSLFTRMQGRMGWRLFPKISITIHAPRRFRFPDDAIGRQRRGIAADQLNNIMADLLS